MRCQVYTLGVEGSAKRFQSYAEAEKADRQFYQKLTGNEKLRMLLQLLNHAPEQRLERVSRITKLPRR
jgi:hypothetical protein